MPDPVAACRRAILTVLPVLPAGLRPAVVLADGRLGTSDLNELYERVIRRNRRLQSLLAMPTPDTMVRDEQRLLQEAVDALFGNGYRGRSLRGRRDVTLAALSDRLKGPEGRFIQGLAGKRVDYSARSVIAPGTSLRLDECGVPEDMALEVFRPFVVGELLRAAIRDRMVILVRAPALHKYSLLAMRPVLHRESVIRLHPYLTFGCNADYDGDEMTLHVPLSAAANDEARTRLAASHNLFATSSGGLMNRPHQDIVLGCWYMTSLRPHGRGAGGVFESALAARNAWKAGLVEAQAPISLRTPQGEVTTTVGRLLFDALLPAGIGPVTDAVDRPRLDRVLRNCQQQYGFDRTAELADAIKEFGFRYATRSGVSVGVRLPSQAAPALLAEADSRIADLRREHEAGRLSRQDLHVRTVDTWSEVVGRVRQAVMAELAARDDGFDPLHMMVRSGVRGSPQQMLMLLAGHGLLPDMFGRIVEFPVRDPVMAGLPEFWYFLKSIGARAGLVMVTLRTAAAGDLMRRLVEALEDVVVVEADCGTAHGLELGPVEVNGRPLQALAERVVGRCAAAEVRTADGTVLVRPGGPITAEAAAALATAGIGRLSVRSPVTCESAGGVCATCYGRDPGTQAGVELGAAVGITAALSLGEPLTQLTMRSFHLGHVYPFSKIARDKAEQDVKYTSAFPRLEEVFQTLEKRRAHGPALDGADPRPDPQAIPDVEGEAAAAEYLADELIRVYAESGVAISSQHTELAVRQLLSRVEVTDPGDTGLVAGQHVSRDELSKANAGRAAAGARPAVARPLLSPLSEVALKTGSFLAAAASWETPRVLARAALLEAEDPLLGMRENILLGQLIPAGTGARLRPPRASRPAGAA